MGEGACESTGPCSCISSEVGEGVGFLAWYLPSWCLTLALRKRKSLKPLFPPACPAPSFPAPAVLQGKKVGPPRTGSPPHADSLLWLPVSLGRERALRLLYPCVTVPPSLAWNTTVSHSLWFLSSSSKSQSLTNAFSFSESSFFRSSASEDEASRDHPELEEVLPASFQISSADTQGAAGPTRKGVQDTCQQPSATLGGDVDALDVRGLLPLRCAQWRGTAQQRNQVTVSGPGA